MTTTKVYLTWVGPGPEWFQADEQLWRRVCNTPIRCEYCGRWVTNGWQRRNRGICPGCGEVQPPSTPEGR